MPYGWSIGTGLVRCDGASNNLQVGQDDQGQGTAYGTIPDYLVKPGGRYELYFEAKAIQTSASAVWGLVDKSTLATEVPGSATFTQDDYTGEDTQASMPISYDPAKTAMLFSCSDCRVRKAEIVLFPNYYRVINRTVTDLVTSTSGTYSYKYDNASPNSTAVSAAAKAGGKLYTPKIREFRGHSMTGVINPDKLGTLNWYYQSDTLKGRPYHTLTLQQDTTKGGFYDAMESIDTAKWTKTGSGTGVSFGSEGIWNVDFDNDPYLNRFLSPDSIIQDSYNPQDWDRFSYVRNNPVNYTDPTGYDVDCTIGESLPNGPGCKTQVKIEQRIEQLNDERDRCAANPGSENCPDYGGLALTGLTVFGAPEAIMGAFNFVEGMSWQIGAQCLANQACRTVLYAILGISTNPNTRPSPNQIGAYGAQQVGNQLPVEVGQFRIIDPATGQVRIYDGRYLNTTNMYVEIKTTLKGVVNATAFIRNQVSFDANMSPKPTWIFVNSQPSGPLMRLLQQTGVVWTQLHVPWPPNWP